MTLIASGRAALQRVLQPGSGLGRWVPGTETTEGCPSITRHQEHALGVTLTAGDQRVHLAETCRHGEESLRSICTLLLGRATWGHPRANAGGPAPLLGCGTSMYHVEFCVGSLSLRWFIYFVKHLSVLLGLVGICLYSGP